MIHSFFRAIAVITIVVLMVASGTVYAQQGGKTYTEEQYLRSLNMLDPRPFDPEMDPDIEMYFNSWRGSIPFNSHGMLIERFIMTHCEDPLDPPRKGAVLKYSNRLSYALLDAGCVTAPTTLDGEQEIFYVISGEGVITGGGETQELSRGKLMLVPAGLEFVITNTGEVPMTFYLLSEPIPDGFRPNDTILVRDERSTFYRDKGMVRAHWIHNGKNIFTIDDGLGTLTAVNIGTMNAMTVGHPHSHGEGIEEVWALIEGRNLEFLGRQIRWMEPGEAFMIPPTGYTPHSHVNTTDSLVKFLLIARWGDRPRRP
jgi:mannose-6-phosphate isomerase-like protein (cupin superfamily)